MTPTDPDLYEGEFASILPPGFLATVQREGLQVLPTLNRALHQDGLGLLIVQAGDRVHYHAKLLARSHAGDDRDVVRFETSQLLLPSALLILSLQYRGVDLSELVFVPPSEHRMNALESDLSREGSTLWGQVFGKAVELHVLGKRCQCGRCKCNYERGSAGLTFGDAYAALIDRYEHPII